MPPKKFWTDNKNNQLMKLYNNALRLKSNGESRNIFVIVHDLWNQTYPDCNVTKSAITSILNRQIQTNLLNDDSDFENLNQSFTELGVQNQTNTHERMCVNYNNLIQYLMQNNLVEVDVPSDGHCLLYPVQLSLARKGFHVQLQEIKNRLIEYFEANIYEFTDFVTTSPNSHMSSSQTLMNEINSNIYQKTYTRNSVDMDVQWQIFSVLE
jgi:hypothetical protein